MTERVKSFLAKHKNLPLLLFIIIYLSVRLCGLYIDVVNPDGINWHERSYFFVKALREVKLENTYQEYHPGVTLMALTGPVLYLTGNYLESLGMSRAYGPENFLIYDYVAKFTVVLVGAVLAFVILLFLRNILNTKAWVMFALLYALEPFFIGQSRLYHLDFLMTSLLFISFLLAYKYVYEKKSLKILVLSALFFALSILTKQTALSFLPVFFLVFVENREGFLKGAKVFGVQVLLTVFFIFLLFPALWVNPQKTLKATFEGLAVVGINGAKDTGYTSIHKNLILNNLTDKVPFYFYWANLIYQLSPLALVSLLVSISFIVGQIVKVISRILHKGIDIYKPQFRLLSKDLKLFYLSFMALCYLLVVLTFAGKKIDRYSVILFPYIFVVISYFVSILRVKIVALLSAAYILILIPQFMRIHPYYYYYADPLLGGLKAKYETVGVKSFGVGVYEANKAIQDDRKSKERVTIEAAKSFSAIATSSKVFKQRKDCECDYIVIFKEDLKKDWPDGDYELFKIIWVDNLDYWYIFKKIK